MPLYHQKAIHYTQRFLPLPKASYMTSAMAQGNDELHSSLRFAVALLEGVEMTNLTEFEALGRTMWNQYRPALYRYSVELASLLASRVELIDDQPERLQRAKPTEPYKRPCFLRSTRVHTSSQGYLKHMGNCRTIENAVKRIQLDIGYSSNTNYNLVIRDHWDRTWTTCSQESPAKVKRLVALLESTYPTSVVPHYDTYNMCCVFDFAIKSEAWQQHTLSQAGSFVHTLTEAVRRMENYTPSRDMDESSYIRDYTRDATRTIQHLNGERTYIRYGRFIRLYGVTPPVCFGNSWPARFEDSMLEDCDYEPLVHQTIDRAYDYDAASQTHIMKPEVLALIRRDQSEDRMYPMRQTEDRIHPMNYQHIASRFEEYRVSDQIIQLNGTFSSRGTYARESDSNTDQVDEGTDAGT